MERTLTCIVCPIGCTLTAETDGKTVSDVRGNACPCGKIYAENECTNPQRTVTSTVRHKDGGLVAVKTETTIPKSKITECMKQINAIVLEGPVKIGDVIREDVCGSRLVATQNRGSL